MYNPTNSQCAPVYNASYGFPDGAQNQIFVGLQDVEGSIGDTLISQEVSMLDSHTGSFLLSPSRTSQLTLKDDGNIVFSDVRTGHVHWQSNTAGIKGVAPYHLSLLNDGNLVLSDENNTVFWETNTAGKGCAPYKLKVRDVVSLALVDCNGETLWKPTMA